MHGTPEPGAGLRGPLVAGAVVLVVVVVGSALLRGLGLAPGPVVGLVALVVGLVAVVVALVRAGGRTGG